MAIQKDFIIKNGLEVKSNLIVADSTIEKVGIGTSVMNNKLQVLGGIGATDIAITGIGTIPTLRSTNAYIGTTYSNAGIITSLSGIGATYSIANFGIVGVNTLNAVSGVVTTLSGSNAFYTNTFVTNEYVSNIFGVSGIVTTLNGTTVSYNTANIEKGNIVSGVVTTIQGTNLNYSGIGTITTSKATTLLATNGYINSGVVTSITGTNLTYSGVGTIATTKATTLLATNGYINSGVVTSITGTNLNYSGVGTITTSKATTLLATNGYIASGVVTSITGTNLNYTNSNITGISTLSEVKIQTGIITSSNSGVVTYYGDGRYLQNIVSGVGISKELAFVGFGATILNFRGSGISTVTVGSGIGTIIIEGASKWSVGTGDNIYRLLGNVGIGTTNPQYKLDVGGDINFTGTLNQNNAPFVASRWTSGIGNDIYRLLGDVGIGTADPTQTLHVVGKALLGGQNGDAHLFVYSDAGGSNISVEGVNKLNTVKKNITLNGYGGNVGIGMTNPTQKLQVQGNILASGTVTASSDERLKTNIKTINNALEKVLSIRGVEYDRIDLEEHQIGVIAQEIEKVIPEVVYGDETKSVAYGNLVGLLIEAIKEQNERIEKLEQILHNK